MISLGMSTLVVSSALAAYATTYFLGGFFVFVGYFVLTGIPFAIVFPPGPPAASLVLPLLDIVVPAGLALAGWTVGVCAGWRKRRI